MKQTFKQFNSFVDTDDDRLDSLSEEQLNKLFGIFRNNEKNKMAFDKREELRKELRKELDAKEDKFRRREAELKAAKAKRFSNDASQYLGSGTNRAKASAMGRAAELDWVNNLASESAKPVVAALKEGRLEVYQVLHEPVGQDQREISRLIREAVKHFNLLSEDHIK